MVTTVITSIVTGVLLGFATSARNVADGREDLTRNMFVGTIGAFVGTRIVGQFFDSPAAGASVIALTVASIFGASIAIFFFNRFRKV